MRKKSKQSDELFDPTKPLVGRYYANDPLNFDQFGRRFVKPSDIFLPGMGDPNPPTVPRRKKKRPDLH
jgi:hypothetical protein